MPKGGTKTNDIPSTFLMIYHCFTVLEQRPVVYKSLR